MYETIYDSYAILSWIFHRAVWYSGDCCGPWASCFLIHILLHICLGEFWFRSQKLISKYRGIQNDIIRSSNHCPVLDFYFLVVMNALQMLNHFHLGLKVVIFNLISVPFCFVFRLNKLGVIAFCFDHFVVMIYYKTYRIGSFCLHAKKMLSQIILARNLIVFV